MDKKEKQVSDVQGTAPATPTGGEVSVKDTVDAYTDLQQDRFYGIYPIYGIIALTIVEYFSTRKIKDIWERFLQQSQEVNGSTGQTRELYLCMKEAFILDFEYGNYDIITTILNIMKGLGMEPLTTNIPKTCLDIFNKMFLSNESQATTTDGKGKRDLYIPVVCVLVADE